MDEKTGLLLNEKNIKLHRVWFKQMLRLIGINVLYYQPKSGKHYTTYTELETNYEKPVLVSCIYNEHPDQKTMKKLGWVSELSESPIVISVPYDLPGVQRGALFLLPSAVDNTKGRLFRVEEMSVGMLYPSSITCKLVPEVENTYSKEEKDYTHSSTRLLYEDDGEEN